VPAGIAQEVAIKSPVDLYVRDLSISSQVLRIDVPEINRFVAGWDLGRGESEVLTVALSQPGTGVVLDDSQARKCAKVMDIPLIGSIGLIIRAKREKLIPFAKPAVGKLVSAGLRIDPEIISQVLRAIGECFVH
jgi:predicted nucleic acid-binding protein